MLHDSRGRRVFVRAPRLRFALYQLEVLASGAPAPRLMYDSTNLFSIPLSAPMVASYLTGYPQSAAAWARFAGKPEITIVQHSGVYAEGDVLDIESGAATYADAFPFIEQRKAAGLFRPTIYCSLDSVANVRQATGKYVLGADYDLWVAHWTGTPHVAYPGSAATQYASKKAYDLSSVNDSGWPHRTAPVYRHVADGLYSLDQIAVKRGTTSLHIAGTTAGAASTAEILGFAGYLLTGADPGERSLAVNALIADDSAPSHTMPKGTVYYTSNP